MSLSMKNWPKQTEVKKRGGGGGGEGGVKMNLQVSKHLFKIVKNKIQRYVFKQHPQCLISEYFGL